MKVVQGTAKKVVIPDLKNNVDGTTAHSPAEKAQLLNSFFCEHTVLPGATLSTPDAQSLKTNEHTLTLSAQHPAKSMMFYRNRERWHPSPFVTNVRCRDFSKPVNNF